MATLYRVFARHAINHAPVEHCTHYSLKDAYAKAEKLHQLGLDGEIQQSSGMGWIKTMEWFNNEEMPIPGDR